MSIGLACRRRVSAAAQDTVSFYGGDASWDSDLLLGFSVLYHTRLDYTRLN